MKKVILYGILGGLAAAVVAALVVRALNIPWSPAVVGGVAGAFGGMIGVFMAKPQKQTP